MTIVTLTGNESNQPHQRRNGGGDVNDDSRHSTNMAAGQLGLCLFILHFWRQPAGVASLLPAAGFVFYRLPILRRRSCGDNQRQRRDGMSAWLVKRIVKLFKFISKTTA